MQKCIQYLEDKIQDIESYMKLISESAVQESKSSAGDKHETSRAMMHLELEKNGNILKELQNKKKLLTNIILSDKNEEVRKGSLINTDKGIFFITIAIGKMEFENQSIQVIADSSPIGKMFLGKNKGDTVEFNGQKFMIENIQ